MNAFAVGLERVGSERLDLTEIGPREEDYREQLDEPV